jgi:hypothetical protein
MLHAKEDEAGRGSSLSCLLQYSIIACTYVEEDVVCACPLFFSGQTRSSLLRLLSSVYAEWRAESSVYVEGGVQCMCIKVW